MHPSPNGSTPTGLDIVCLSHLRWDLVFQRPHHLMTRAAHGGRGLYVEEPGDALTPHAEVRSVATGVDVLVPYVPRGLSPEASELVCADLVRDAMRKRGMEHT